jgi:hypothetical protein
VRATELQKPEQIITKATATCGTDSHVGGHTERMYISEQIQELGIKPHPLPIKD